MENMQPASIHVIKDLDAAKAIADPLRLQIMEVMTSKPLTVKQVAEKLGLSASKLYYHINTLEKHDFIRVVDTVVHGNIIEKHYWVTAYDYQVDHNLFNFDVTEREGQDNILTMALTTLDTAREDFVRSINARVYNLEHGADPHPRHLVNFREVCRVSDEKIQEFQSRLKALLHEFEELDETKDQDDSSHPWALNVFMYPPFYYDQADAD